MSIFSGSTEIQSIYAGSTEVQEVYSGSNLVWTNLPSLTVASADWPIVEEDPFTDVTFPGSYIQTTGDVGGVSFNYYSSSATSKDLTFSSAGTYRFSANVLAFFSSNWDGFNGRFAIRGASSGTGLSSLIGSTGIRSVDVVLTAGETVTWEIRTGGSTPASANGDGYIRWNNFTIEKVS